MQGTNSERNRLTVEVCEAVAAISPAGSHLATTAARLREMVGQEVPAGEYMKEAERLLAEHEQAAGLCRYADCQTTRSALLAHIQRGAVPEEWQVVPSADQLWNNDEVMALNAELGLTMDQLSRLASAITRIAHPADWRERFSQAVYDDLAAADNQDVPLEEYPARILKVLDAVIGREIKPAPAEAPMPEPDYRGPAEAGDYFSGYTHTTMCTYGDAREAAGYARGLRDAVRDA